MRSQFTILTTVTAAALLGTQAWAQEMETEPRVEAEAAEVTKGMLEEEKFAIRPQAGVLVYSQPTGADQGRFATGLTIDWNLAETFWPDTIGNRWAIGPSTGLIYSHLGPPSSNFFGSDAPVQVDAGANFFYVPVNAKIGYNVLEKFRVSLHGGANITYRSIPSTIVIGGDPDSTTTAFPNVGADLEWGLGKVALGLRPDVTLGTERQIFSGTLMVAIPLA